MSRAFTKETDADTIDLPDRPVSAHPNYVTAEGLAAIDRTIVRFGAAHAAAVQNGDKAAVAAAQRELRYWTARRASAQLIAAAPQPARVVQFGATVTLRREDGRTQTFRIVGEDEAEPSHGTLSYVSPLARALYGKAPGDVVAFAAGAAEIVTIA